MEWTEIGIKKGGREGVHKSEGKGEGIGRRGIRKKKGNKDKR
jgi:hypothetical protein